MNMEHKLRHRRYMITWNNWEEHFPSDASPEYLATILYSRSLTQYIIVSQEIAPTTNKVHLHIYIEYQHQATFDQMKIRFPGAHIEIAIANGQQASNYCKKDKVYYEKGEYTSRKLSTEDVASNVINLLEDYHPTQIARLYPQYASYIVRNFKSLLEIRQYLPLYDDKPLTHKGEE
jgi:hypothetical protein